MRRVAAGAVALVAVVALSLTAAGTAGAGVSAHAAKSMAPGLAKAVADAKTTTARVAAIDKIMAALHVDVINPENGAVVVKGAARSLKDADLYANEVQWLAAGYAARDRVTVRQVVIELNGVYPKLGLRLSAAKVGGVLLKVTRADARNSDPDSKALVPRLVWQLGLLDKPAQDLAKKIPVSKIRLDPLQAWLIVADFTMPLAYSNPVPAHAASRLAALSGGVVKKGAGAAASGCDVLTPLKEALEGLGQYAKTVAGQTWDNMQKAEKEDWQLVFDLLHLGVMFTGVDLSSSVTPASTELGGPPMRFAVGVSMSFRLPDVNVKCGYLGGYHFPGHGAIQGVKIEWDNSELDPWGTFTCGSYCAKTGPSGVARETFTPGPEEVHKGLTVIESGKVEANALVSTSLGNKIVGLADALRVPAVMRWELKHHKTGFPTGFSAHLQTNNPNYYSADLAITGIRDNSVPHNCEPSRGVCEFKVKHIQGTITENDGNRQCVASVPPYNGLSYLIALSGFGKKKDLTFSIDFTVQMPQPCGYPQPVSFAQAHPAYYEDGETNTPFSISFGSAVITWEY